MAQAEDTARLQANEIAKSLKGPLLEVIRRVERLSEDFPSDKDFHFYNNFPQFKSPVRRIQTQAEALLNEIGLSRNLRPEASAFPSDPDESYDWLVALQDDLVERVDTAVDQLNKETLAGKRSAYESPRKFQTSNSSPGDGAKLSKGSSERRPVPFHVKSIPRPQNKFEFAVDNSNTPFKHPQAPKADAQKRGLSALDLHARKLGATFEDMHPLEEELTKMEYVDPKMLEEPVPQEPRPIAETPLTVVSTLSELNEMAAKCMLAGEIAVGQQILFDVLYGHGDSTAKELTSITALGGSTLLTTVLDGLGCRRVQVDLENHHYRSFQGFVCLMQVSTRSEDFIVDTLALRSHISPCLKDIFADARIRKVMHGADRDIVWLQRDFGIYVCNMFDTGQAARVLQLEGFGLAFLMQHFLNMNPDKRYQLADWRIRPMPAEMIKYAREDTHYLLYLYDLLKAQLVSMRSSAENDMDDPLLQVYKRSRDICLLMYKKDILTETSYLSLYGLQDRQLNPKQMSVLASLHAWRDKLARKLDESTGFVLPNQLLFKLAEEMPDTARTLQTTIRGPHSLVGQHAAEVLEVIKQSKEKALMPAPDASLSILGQSETKSTPVIEASDGLSAEMSTITTQAVKMVSDVVSTDTIELMEEDVETVSASHEDVDEKSASVVELDIGKEQPCGDLKAGETTRIKEITVGSSLSPQVMVTRPFVEEISPASTVSTRISNAAVVKRASVPSLALFGGSSKKKRPAINKGLSTESKAISTKPVKLKPIETKPTETRIVETNAVESSSRPGTSSSITVLEAAKLSNESSQASELSNAVVEEIPEGVIVTLRPNDEDDGNGENTRADPSCAFAPSEEDPMTGAAGVTNQAVDVKELDVSPVEAESGRAAVTTMGTSLAVADGLIEHEQESKSAAAGEALSKDIGQLQEPRGNEVPLRGSHVGEDIVMVAAEEEKASNGQIVNSTKEETKALNTKAMNLAASPGPTVAAVKSTSVSGVARPGLGSMLGSSALRKRQKRSNEDMEMVAAKLRANRIQASVSLPFHKVPALGEPDTEMLSGPETTEPIFVESGNDEPLNSQPTSSGQEAAQLEELGDYVGIQNTKRDSEERPPYEAATNDSSNWSNKFATKEERSFPRTLNQMRRRSRHHEREKHPADSSTHQKQHKNISENNSSGAEADVESTFGEAVFQPFDYEAARRDAGLEQNLISRNDDSESGRGRGRGRPVNPNKRQKQMAPPSTGGPVQAFDPLRRVRREPRPEGIHAPKRRQVFPQSGNRTFSFNR